MPSLQAVLRAAVAGALLVGCGSAAPPPPPVHPSIPLPRPRVVDISQWPDRDTLLPILSKTAAPLVAFDEEHLEVLRGCALPGNFTSRPFAPSASEPPRTRLFATQADIDAAFPLHDPDLVASPGLPVAVSIVFSEQWDLATLERNEIPTADPCARATHVVTGVRFGSSGWRAHKEESRVDAPSGPLIHDPSDLELVRDQRLEDDTVAACADPHGDCAHPLVLVLTPIGTNRPVEAATLVHLKPFAGETWSATLDKTPICPLPCDRWILPETTLTMKRSAGEKEETLNLHNTFPGARERDAVITRRKDDLYPWLGVSLLGVGLGFTALGTALTVGAITPSSSGSGSGPSSALAVSAKDAGGILLLDLLALCMDVSSIVYLAKGPELVPTFRVDDPAKKQARTGPRGSKRGATITASPIGVGLSF